MKRSTSHSSRLSNSLDQGRSNALQSFLSPPVDTPRYLTPRSTGLRLEFPAGGRQNSNLYPRCVDGATRTQNAMKTLFFACLLLALAANSALAQSPNHDFEPILLPVSLRQPVPGAFGSIWATDFWVAAVGGVVHLELTVQCLACAPERVLFNGTLNDIAIGTFPDESPGELIWLNRADAANARFSLRVRDLSRESQTWGTEIPVVRESQYRTTSITLLNVPLDSRFRVALRAYDPDVHEHQHASFRFDFRDMQGGALLASRTVAAVYSITSGQTFFPRVAACAQLGDLRGSVPEIANQEIVRVDVSPLGEATRFWAFASVTNNETQHVTLITPQQQP
jgi:hypothetical protein